MSKRMSKRNARPWPAWIIPLVGILFLPFWLLASIVLGEDVLDWARRKRRA